MEVITTEQLVQFIVLDMVQNLGKIKRVNCSPGIPTGQKKLAPSELIHFQLIEEKINSEIIYRMEQIFSCMGAICKSTSQKILLIQNQFEFAAKSNTQKHLIKGGFMNNYLFKKQSKCNTTH